MPQLSLQGLQLLEASEQPAAHSSQLAVSTDQAPLSDKLFPTTQLVSALHLTDQLTEPLQLDQLSDPPLLEAAQEELTLQLEPLQDTQLTLLQEGQLDPQ